MKRSFAIEKAESYGYEGLVHSEQNNRHTLPLLIGGVHCAGCIKKIESSLLDIPCVTGARLNFSTGRLNIEWHGSPSLADEYVHTIEGLGYHVTPYNPDLKNLAEDERNRFLLLCLGVAGFAAGNIMLLSVGLWTTSAETMGFATRELFHWISALIAVPAVIFSGRPFFYSAFAALKSGRTNMDVPISVGLILACGMSVFETVRGAEHAYFDSAVMLMFFLLIGRYLDFRARRHARSAATDLLQTLVGFAAVVQDGKIRKIPIRDLREGMLIGIAAGEKIPADGVVISGESTVDTSLVTGETLPQRVVAQSLVYAGTLNISGPVTVMVSKMADDSLLADIVRLMEKAEQGQAKYVRAADRAAALYTPVVHILALLAFLMWWWILGLNAHDSLMIAVTVLIITCPCALALAVPVVQVSASGKLFQQGIFVKSGDALERLAKIDVALLDKTGTLTLGKPQLTGEYRPEDLKLAASLARYSNHPLSKALFAAYKDLLVEVADVKEFPGKGLEGFYQGQSIRLGSRAWCGGESMDNHESLELWLNIEGRQPALFLFCDKIRMDAHQTIYNLQAKNIRTILLSGDRDSAVKAVAKQCGIMEFYSMLTPVQKFDHLQALKNEGHKILMVGDGLNDAPVLAGADVSMAPGTAIDMAQNAADIVFMGENLGAVNKAHSVAVKSQRLVIENFAITIAYNMIAIPLAFCGYVTPLVAALAMSGSSLLVIANSLRLKRV